MSVIQRVGNESVSSESVDGDLVCNGKLVGFQVGQLGLVSRLQ